MIDKRTFKICEAVALGITHYYMGPRDKRKITDRDIKLARKIIPTLKGGWMQKADRLPWSCMNKRGKKYEN